MLQASSEHRLDRRFFIPGVFLLLFALGTVEGPGGDAAWRLVITQQILAYGRVHLVTDEEQFGLLKTPSGWTTFSTIGQTLLFIPFETAGKVLSVVLNYPHARVLPTRYLYCPVVGLAYFLALLGLLEALGVPSRTAGVVSLVFTFSSITAYYVAQSYQEESVASVFACLSLRAALMWRKSPELRYAFQAGLFGASILLIRLNGIFVLIPVAVFFLQGAYAAGLTSPRVRQGVAIGLLGALGPAAVHAIFGYLRFGHPFSTSYDQLAFTTFNYGFSASKIGSAFLLLLGPGKGLFLYSPLLVIALWGSCLKRVRLYGITCFLALAGGVILTSGVIIGVSFIEADGCWSWGARYQAHILPLFAYPAWMGMRDLFARRLGRAVVVTAIGFGLFSQFLSMVGSDRVEYLQVLNSSSAIGEASRASNIYLCEVVRSHQFAMRLGNAANVIRMGATGRPIEDKLLHQEFATLWGLRLARDVSGWKRGAVTLTWLGFLAGAATCLYRALHTKPASYRSKPVWLRS